MEQIRLDLIPKFLPPTCHVSQYDKGRIVRCYLTDDGGEYTILSGDSIVIYVRKPDGRLVTSELTCVVGNNYVDFVTDEQMTAVAGNSVAEMKITNGTKTIGTSNFYINVERDPTDGSISSESEIHDLQEQVNSCVSQSLSDLGIEDLGGVEISSPTDGQSLIYDSETGKWVNGSSGGGGGGSSTLSGLTDVNLSSPSNGQTLVYDSNSGKWVNGPNFNLPNPPSLPGVYNLSAQIVNGSLVYTWVKAEPFYSISCNLINTINENDANYEVEVQFS